MKLLTPHFISVDYNQIDPSASSNEASKNEVAKSSLVNEVPKKGVTTEATKNGAIPVTEVLKKGLFYSKSEQEEYIITDTFMLKDEDVLRIHVINSESYSATLKNRKNVGLGYWQFECVRIKEKKKHMPTTHKKGYDFI
jgi:phage major head subunit gpT-like protein